MPRRAASRTPQPQAPAAQVLTSAVHSHVAVVAARLTGSDALIERRLRPLRVAQRKRVEMTRGASSDVAMPRVGRVCCRLDPARFAPRSGSPLHGNFRLAGPQDRRLRGNSAHVAGPGSDAQGRPSCPPRSKGLFGSRDPRWPPPPLGFPFPHRPDQGQAGQWSHHSTTVDKNKWPLALAWRLFGPQYFSLHPARQARRGLFWVCVPFSIFAFWVSTSAHPLPGADAKSAPNFLKLSPQKAC